MPLRRVASTIARRCKVVLLDPLDGSLAEIERRARYKGAGMLDAAVYMG